MAADSTRSKQGVGWFGPELPRQAHPRTDGLARGGHALVTPSSCTSGLTGQGADVIISTTRSERDGSRLADQIDSASVCLTSALYDLRFLSSVVNPAAG